MTSKKLATLAGISCIAVLVTYAWATTQEVKEVKVEEAGATVEKSDEPTRLCIPKAEANDTNVEVAETSSESTTDAAKTEESPEKAEVEDAGDETLPICDEDGNPPAPENAEASDGNAEKSTEGAAEEPVKEEAIEEPTKTE